MEGSQGPTRSLIPAVAGTSKAVVVAGLEKRYAGQHAIALIRPLLAGAVPQQVWLHGGVILAYFLVAGGVAEWLFRRRILR